jgi:DNA repair protein RadC
MGGRERDERADGERAGMALSDEDDALARAIAGRGRASSRASTGGAKTTVLRKRQPAQGNDTPSGAGAAALALSSPSLTSGSGEPQQTASREQPHYHGHRERLRERFLSSGAEALQDYELLELLLFAVIPRRDVKPLAKRMLAALGGLWAVTQAEPASLRQRFGLSDAVIAAIKTPGALALRMARQQVMDQPILSSWQKLLDYCAAAMAHEQVEQFRLLFLDRKNALIADEVQQRGTVDHTPVYPREVVRRALELGASAIILVHNHPSGDPAPSKADVEMTKHITAAAAAIGLHIHDHLIIGKGGRYVSFKSAGLM